MRAIIFSALCGLLALSGSAEGYRYYFKRRAPIPACPEPPSADTLSGAAAGRGAPYRAVAACLCDGARHEALADFSHYQNLDKSSLALSPMEFSGLMYDMAAYRRALKLCD